MIFMAFLESSDFIYQSPLSGLVGGDFAFDTSLFSGAEDVSGRFQEAEISGGATDEAGALAGFIGNITTNEITESPNRPGTDIMRLILGIFSVSGQVLSPAYTWELKKNIVVNAAGNQVGHFKLWRHDKSAQEWMTNSGGFEFSNMSDNDAIDHAILIIINFYYVKTYNASIPTTEGRQAATDFVIAAHNNQGNESGIGGLGAGIGVALIAGIVLLLIANRGG